MSPDLLGHIQGLAAVAVTEVKATCPSQGVPAPALLLHTVLAIHLAPGNTPHRGSFTG